MTVEIVEEFSNEDFKDRRGIIEVDRSWIRNNPLEALTVFHLIKFLPYHIDSYPYKNMIHFIGHSPLFKKTSPGTVSLRYNVEITSKDGKIVKAIPKLIDSNECHIPPYPYTEEEFKQNLKVEMSPDKSTLMVEMPTDPPKNIKFDGDIQNVKKVPLPFENTPLKNVEYQEETFMEAIYEESPIRKCAEDLMEQRKKETALSWTPPKGKSIPYLKDDEEYKVNLEISECGRYVVPKVVKGVSSVNATLSLELELDPITPAEFIADEFTSADKNKIWEAIKSVAKKHR